MVDFNRIINTYNDQPISYTFIPEIWQGHLNQGAGFHKALTLIEDTIGAE